MLLVDYVTYPFPCVLPFCFEFRVRRVKKERREKRKVERVRKGRKERKEKT